MSDFKIQHKTCTIPAGAASFTIVAGFDYDMPSSVSKAWCQPPSFAGIGNIDTSVNLNSVVSWAYIETGDVTVSITFKRGLSSVSAGIVIPYEIREYIGAAGGPNEIKVWGAEKLTFGASSNAVNGSTLGVGSTSKMFIFHTGQGIDTSSGQSDAQASFDWDNVNHRATAARFRSATNTSFVSYAAVELIGPNWSAVQRLSHMIAAANTQEDVTITDVGSLARILIDCQFQSSQQANAGACAQSWLSATNKWSTKASTAYSAATLLAVVWIASNSDTTATKAISTRYTGTFNTDAAQDLTITSVFAVNNTSIVGISQSNTLASRADSRIGAAYNITAKTTVNASHIGLSSGSEDYSFYAFEWPGVTPPVADHLTMTGQPTTAITGRVFGTNVTVEARDSSDVLVTTDVGAVAMAITVLTGEANLFGTTPRSCIAGAVTFDDLYVNCSDGATFKLVPSRVGITSGLSTTITGTVRSNDCSCSDAGGGSTPGIGWGKQLWWGAPLRWWKQNRSS